MKSELIIKELVSEIKQELINKNMQLATAESATCGMLSCVLGSENGISNVYIGGSIVYSELAKIKILKINKKIIRKYGTISYECAREMVKNTAKLLKCSNVIAITGNAGPSAIENKGVGRFYCGFMINENIYIDELSIDAKFSRNEMREKVVEYCLNVFMQYLRKINK